MVLIAQLDEILNVRRPTIDPMADMVDVSELGVGAAGEPASLVASSDFQALGVAGVPSGPAEVEAAAVGPVGRKQDLGIAGEPPSNFA
jgi:hypothetical protein